MKLTYHQRKFKVPILEVCLLIAGCIYLLPVYVALLSTFKSKSEIIQNPLAFPTTLYWQNILDVFKFTDLLNAFWKSGMMCVAVICTVLVVSPMAAYRVIRTWEGRGKWVYAFFVAGMAIPFLVYMIPLLRELRFLGLNQSYPGLFLTYMGRFIPFSLFIYCGFVKSVPLELEQAAAIDGCGPLRTYWNIVFPLLQPCHVTIIVFYALFTWNDFAIAYMVMGVSKANLVFTEVYKLLSGSWYTDWNVVFAGIVVASLPITLVYLILQRQLIKGLTAGAVKG